MQEVQKTIEALKEALLIKEKYKSDKIYFSDEAIYKLIEMLESYKKLDNAFDFIFEENIKIKKIYRKENKSEPTPQRLNFAERIKIVNNAEKIFYKKIKKIESICYEIYNFLYTCYPHLYLYGDKVWWNYPGGIPGENLEFHFTLDNKKRVFNIMINADKTFKDTEKATELILKEVASVIRYSVKGDK